MNTLIPNNTRKGFIVVITLILLLVMTTMGIGLFYSTKQTAKQVSISGSRTESLYTAESCITEAVQWIESESAKGPPCKSPGAGSICNKIPPKLMGQWQLSGETTAQRNRMNAHRYRCDISLLGAFLSGSGTGTGFDIGQSSTYGGGTTRTKYLYKIKSKAYGFDKRMREVEVIVSIIL
jgi:type IV pilus assembly protein PilX